MAQQRRGVNRIGEAHAAELPRDRILTLGPGSLSNGELLSVLLDIDRNAAQDLLLASGGVRGLLEAGVDNLLQLPGITLRRAAILLASQEVHLRFMSSCLERGDYMTDPGIAGQFFVGRLRGYPSEVFAVAFLDCRHKMIAFEEMFRGSLDGAEVHPREVVRRSLELNAAAVIVGHNHPSGSAEPSAADRAVTARLKQALALVDIRLLDHFVVGDGAPTSLAARGWV